MRTNKGNRNSFHNTTGAKGFDRLQNEIDAQAQEKIILAFLSKNRKVSYTPSQMHKKLFKKTNTPITSVRRALSNLTEAGFLRKLKKQSIGTYGKPEHHWKIKYRN